jgi:hypothetical protein
MTRSRIKIDGKFYKVVPWLKHEDCDGCHFWEQTHIAADCPNQQSKVQFCDTGGEFYGKVFIEHGKEGLARYIAVKLEGSNDQHG